MMVMKLKNQNAQKSEDYRNCLVATQLEHEINHPEKNSIEVDILRESHKEFIKKQQNDIKITAEIQK